MTKRKRPSRSPAVVEPAREETHGVVSRASELPEATRERLAELSRLEPDWDSYGALRVAPQAIAAAGAIVGQVIDRAGAQGAPRDIMPLADGGVALEWRRHGLELGLNACPEGGWSALLVERNESGRRATERYDLADAEALALIFKVIGADDAR